MNNIIVVTDGDTVDVFGPMAEPELDRFIDALQALKHYSTNATYHITMLEDPIPVLHRLIEKQGA